MTVAVKKLLASFESLTRSQKREAIAEICRRIAKLEKPPVSDQELVASAEAAFLALDAREATDEKRRAR